MRAILAEFTQAQTNILIFVTKLPIFWIFELLYPVLSFYLFSLGRFP